MTEFTESLFWAALQLTLVAVPALVLTLMLRKRSPSAGWLIPLTALALGVGLLVSGHLPKPELPWDESLALPAPTATAKVERPATSGEPLGLPLTMPDFGAAPVGEISAPEPSAAAVIGWLFLLGVAVHLARLAWGLFAARRLCRRAAEPTDARLTAELTALCQRLGIRRPVRVLVGPDVATAALVGWSRPAVLLSDRWPEWTPGELRAALAHELAHVKRGDFALGVLGRLALAVQFYHPLARWAHRQFRHGQELAADALAARCLGGQRYSVALAKLALRRPIGAAEPALARPLISRGREMIRRIDMVRTRNTQAGGGKVIAALAVAATVGLAVGISSLRAGEPEKPGQASGEPLKAEYLPAEGVGVVVIRADAVTGGDTALLRKLARAADAIFGVEFYGKFPVEKVSQIGLGLRLSHDADAAKGQRHSLSSDLALIRFREAMDWDKFLKSLPVEAEKVEHAGKAYYRVAKAFNITDPGVKMCWCFADERTLILRGEEAVKAYLEGNRPKTPEWLKDWDRVSGRDVAVALNPEAVRENWKSIEPDEPMLKPVGEALAGAGFIVAGVSMGERSGYRIEVGYGDVDRAGEVMSMLAGEFLGNLRAVAEIEASTVEGAETSELELNSYRMSRELAAFDLNAVGCGGSDACSVLVCEAKTEVAIGQHIRETLRGLLKTID